MNNTDPKRVTQLIWTIWVSVLANIGLIVTAVWFMSALNLRVANLEDCQEDTVKKSDYSYLEKDVYDLKNKVWYKRDTRFETRGGDPVMPNL